MLCCLISSKNHKASLIDRLHWNKVRNRLIGKRRFVTERTFGTLKQIYGLSRTRYLGLAKVNAEIIVKSIAYNLKRAKTVWLSIQESCAQNKEIA